MPSCVNCGSSTTPAVIEVGDGLAIEGVGTPSAPYKIELASESDTLAFQVRDSATINFTFTGAGTDQDPFILTGDTGSATSLTGLADYHDNTLPNNGDVVTWVGSSASGHWESSPLPAGTAPTTSASSLTSGILANARLSGVLLDQLAGTNFTGDANTLLVPGMYRTAAGWSNGAVSSGLSALGTLVVYAVGTAVTQVFTDASTPAAWVRAKYGAADWTAWQRQLSTGDMSTEVAARTAAIRAEELQRTAADTAEANARTAADNAEANARASADNTETNNRVAGDANLQNQINTANGNITSVQNNVNSVYSNYDGGRLDSRYYTQGNVQAAINSAINGRGLYSMASGSVAGVAGGSTVGITYPSGRFSGLPTVTTGIYTGLENAQTVGIADNQAGSLTLHYYRAGQTSTATITWIAVQTY